MLSQSPPGQSPSTVSNVTPPRAPWPPLPECPPSPSPKWNLALISILIKNKTCFTQDLGNPGIYFATMQTTDSRILAICVLRTRPWLFLQFGSNTSPMIDPSSHSPFLYLHLLSSLSALPPISMPPSPPQERPRTSSALLWPLPESVPGPPVCNSLPSPAPECPS